MMLGIEEIMCELSGSGGGGESEMNGGRGGGGGGLPPGFRFHPTDEELLTFYLASKVFNSATLSGVDIAEVDLNRIEPWELPEVAKMGEREWYFFSLRDRKYPTGLRTNRATGAGYWKATGKDREVYSSGSGQTLLGMKKTLVFYKGRAPRGEKTKWVMHEYRLDGDFSFRHMCKEEWVICRIFHKLGEKKVNGGHGQSCYPHFHHQIMEPPSPTPSTMTKKPFATTIPESTTPLMQNDPPMPQTPFLFGDSLENIHDQDLKSLLNHLPLYPCIQTGPNPSTYTNAVNPSPSLVKSFPLSNQSITIPVAKQCKTEAHFSNLQLPDANLRWWGTDKTCEPYLNNYNSSPSPLLLPFGQQDLGEMDYFLNTTLPAAAAGDGGTRSTAEGTSVYKRLRTGGLDRVGFNQMLLPSI